MTPAELSAGGRGVSQWQRPRVESVGVQRYARILRERLGTIAVAVAVTTLAALCYLAVAEKSYQAEADLLVTPVVGDDPAVGGLGLIRESSDPTRDVETAARLVISRDVANRVRTRLHLPESSPELLKKIDAAPVAQSNVVAITAKAAKPALARNLANGFADGVVAGRNAALAAQLDKLIPTLRRRISSGETGGTTVQDSLSGQLARLESLRASGDPTMRVETRAEIPTSPTSPKPMLTIVAAIIGGLVLGIGGAFVLHAVDPRLRREEQLRELYSLPILGRIPEDHGAETQIKGKRRLKLGPRRTRRAALGPGALSPRTSEAYRTVRSMLAATRPSDGNGRSILVTGPSPSEGKTTTAINLAASLALAGNRVILIEADFRRPTMGEALGVRPRVGIGKVLLGNVSLEEALVPTPIFEDSVRVLLADHSDDWLGEILALPSSRSLLEDARSLADYVIIDSPPLTEVIDALPLARQVDDVLLVTRLGSSNLSQLSRLGDLLAQNGITPAGFVLVGVGSSQDETYYLSARRERGLMQPHADGEHRAGEPARSARS